MTKDTSGVSPGTAVQNLEAQSEPSAIANLAELLASNQAAHADGVTMLADMSTYEGHVALALDADLPADLGMTLDLLTLAPDLFDVPAMSLDTQGDVAGA